MLYTEIAVFYIFDVLNNSPQGDRGTRGDDGDKGARGLTVSYNKCSMCLLHMFEYRTYIIYSVF